MCVAAGLLPQYISTSAAGARRIPQIHLLKAAMQSTLCPLVHHTFLAYVRLIEPLCMNKKAAGVSFPCCFAFMLQLFNEVGNDERQDEERSRQPHC